MYVWPDFYPAKEIFALFKEKHCPEPTSDMSELDFKHRCDQLWALDDLLNYLEENWFEDTPFEIISDYIDDAYYRADKYKDISPMGDVYKTAGEIAEEIIHCFESFIAFEEGELI